jgi:hypothetical protein
MLLEQQTVIQRIYLKSKCWLVAWLVGDHLLLRDFAPYGITFMNMCVCCYNRCRGNAVKGFWALWYNIYECVFTTLDFPVILDGQFTGSHLHKLLP